MNADIKEFISKYQLLRALQDTARRTRYTEDERAARRMEIELDNRVKIMVEEQNKRKQKNLF